MSVVRDRYEETIRDVIAPVLKEHCFSKQRRTFHRPVGENWEVIDFQASQFSSAEELSFTVNLAVGIARLRQEPLTWDDGKRPSEPRCQVRQRIGFLFPENLDRWWSITEDTDTEEVGHEITRILIQLGLPWLEARSTDERLRDLWLSQLDELMRHELHRLGQLVSMIGPPEAERAVLNAQAAPERS